MGLTEEQRRCYEATLRLARNEVEEADHAIQLELSKLKGRLAELQGAKSAALQLYEAACVRLGRTNDLEEEEIEEERAIGW